MYTGNHHIGIQPYSFFYFSNFQKEYGTFQFASSCINWHSLLYNQNFGELNTFPSLCAVMKITAATTTTKALHFPFQRSKLHSHFMF